MGTRIGVLDLNSADDMAPARVEKQETAASSPKEATLPALSEQSGHVADVTLNISALRQELESLSRGLAAETMAGPPALPIHSVLSQKKVAVIGFGGNEQESIQRFLGVQSSVPVAFDHIQAASVPAPWQDCDLIMLNAPLEWAVTEPIDPGCWARINKPTLVFGTTDVLTRAARVIQTGARDFIPAPWTVEYVTWRAAMLLSHSSGTPIHLKLPARSSKPEIVIADDDPTTRALLSAMLSRHGMVCHLADNGGTALELVRSVHPDAAILDVSMPCLNGFQVLASIKQDPSLASTQVVLLTSRQTEVDVLQGFGLGADDYMTKPFSPMELAARIKRLLARVA
jgi:CheY-like chemotaxis protein